MMHNMRRPSNIESMAEAVIKIIEEVYGDCADTHKYCSFRTGRLQSFRRRRCTGRARWAEIHQHLVPDTAAQVRDGIIKSNLPILLP